MSRRVGLITIAALMLVAGAALATVPISLYNRDLEGPLGSDHWSAFTYRDATYQPVNCSDPTVRDVVYGLCPATGTTTTTAATTPTGTTTPTATATPTATVTPTGIPAQTIGLLNAAKAKVSGTAVSLLVNCVGAGSAQCAGKLELSVVETKRGGKIVAVTAAKSSKQTKKTVVVGSAGVMLVGGRSKTVKVRLNATGKGLLSQRHTLHVKLVVTQLASQSGAVSSSIVTFKAKLATKKRRR